MSEEQKYKVVFDELKLVPGNYITATSDLGTIGTAATVTDEIKINRFNTWDLRKVKVGPATADVDTDLALEYYDYAVNSVDATKLDNSHSEYLKNIADNLDTNKPLKIIGSNENNSSYYLNQAILNKDLDVPVYYDISEFNGSKGQYNTAVFYGTGHKTYTLVDDNTSFNAGELNGIKANSINLTNATSTVILGNDDIDTVNINNSYGGSSYTINVHTSKINKINTNKVCSSLKATLMPGAMPGDMVLPEILVNNTKVSDRINLDFSINTSASQKVVLEKNKYSIYLQTLSNSLIIRDTEVYNTQSSGYTYVECELDNAKLIAGDIDITTKAVLKNTVELSANSTKFEALFNNTVKVLNGYVYGYLPKKLIAPNSSANSITATNCDFFVLKEYDDLSEYEDFKGIGLVLSKSSSPAHNIYNVWDHMVESNTGLVNLDKVDASSAGTYTFNIPKTSLLPILKEDYAYKADILESLGEFTASVTSAVWYAGNNYSAAVTEADDTVTLKFTNVTNSQILTDNDYINLTVKYKLGNTEIRTSTIKVSPTIEQTASFRIEEDND